MDVFSLVAKITLDSSEYDKSLGDAEQKSSTFGDVLKANLASDAIINGLGAVVNGVKAVGGAIFGMAQQSVSAYAEYEQLEGGVKKLYGNMGQSVEEYAAAQGKSVEEVKEKWQSLEDAQNLVLQNASQAYRTAGMSMNDYMNTATSFSAALINSLGGDTVAAAEKTDVAMRAISDNFNTFGGDIGMIQGAFQGFAKQNYTMLDNLKLGYGGTKDEMQRLIDDANEYAATIGESSNLSISSFADIVTAIDLVQQKQNIAGTTAREAATTIEGSMGMVKGAWENVLTAFSNGSMDASESINALIESIVGREEATTEVINGYSRTYTEHVNGLIDNILPVAEQALTGVSTLIQQLAPVIAEQLPGAVETILPLAIDALGSIIAAVAGAVPELIPAVWEAIKTAFMTTAESVGLGAEAEAAFGAIKQAVDNIIPGISEAFNGLIEAISPITDAFSEYVSSGEAAEDATGFVTTAIELLGAGIELAIDIIAEIITKITDLVTWLQSGSTEVDILTAAVAGVTAAFVAYKVALGISSLITAVKNAMALLTSEETKAKLAQLLLNAAMNANPIMIIITLIAGLVAAIITLWTTNEDFRDSVQKVMSDVAGFFTEAGESISKKWGELMDWFAGIPDRILGVFEDNKDNIWGIGGKVVSWIGEGIKNAWTGLIDMVSGLVKKLLGQAKDDVNAEGASSTGGSSSGSSSGTRTNAGGHAVYAARNTVRSTAAYIDDATSAEESSLLPIATTAENGDVLESTGGSESTGMNYEKMANAIVRAIVAAGLTVEIDDREFGRIVRKVVTA